MGGFVAPKLALLLLDRRRLGPLYIACSSRGLRFAPPLNTWCARGGCARGRPRGQLAMRLQCSQTILRASSLGASRGACPDPLVSPALPSPLHPSLPPLAQVLHPSPQADYEAGQRHGAQLLGGLLLLPAVPPAAATPWQPWQPAPASSNPGPSLSRSPSPPLTAQGAQDGAGQLLQRVLGHNLGRPARRQRDDAGAVDAALGRRLCRPVLPRVRAGVWIA